MNVLEAAERREKLLREIRVKLLAPEPDTDPDKLEEALVAALRSSSAAAKNGRNGSH